MWRLPLTVFFNRLIFTKIIKEWKIGICIQNLPNMGHFFHEKSFYRLVEIVFFSSNFGENCQLKIQKHWLRQAEYQLYGRSILGSVSFTCNGQHP
jgi:hypothetical protein